MKKFHKFTIKILLFCLVSFLVHSDLKVFSQEIPDVPFNIVEIKKNVGGPIYIFLEEKYFSRGNLEKLFAYISKSYPNNPLGVTVFSDKEILMKQINWDKMGIYHTDNRDATPARKEFFDKYMPPETGYFRAFYSRNSSTEYFRYSPKKEGIRLITVTLRNERSFSNNEEFLFNSIKLGHIEAVRWVLNKTPKINLDVSDNENMTPLEWSLWLQHNEIAQSLISAGADVNFKTRSPSPLFVAIDAENYQGVKLLITNKVDVNAPDELGQTPLMAAVVYCNFEITKLLLENGADKNAKDKSGKTVAMYACDDKKIIELLSGLKK